MSRGSAAGGDAIPGRAMDGLLFALGFAAVYLVGWYVLITLLVLGAAVSAAKTGGR